MNIYLYIAAIALTTYLIRVLPMTVVRRPIRSRFFRSFLYYVPYACLSAMAFPAILTSTRTLAGGVAALGVSIALALGGRGLATVAVGSAVAAFLAEWIVSIF